MTNVKQALFLVHLHKPGFWRPSWKKQDTTKKKSNQILPIAVRIFSNFGHCTEVHFASFLSGGFITAIVVNPPERKLTKRTSVHCTTAHLKFQLCQQTAMGHTACA